MTRQFLAVSALVGLAACGGGEFLFPLPDGGTDGGPGGATGGVLLTQEVNRVTYDTGADQLVVNNLPFDGPDGLYQRVAARTEVNGFGVYTSLQTPETGQRRYFAVFRQTGSAEVAAIGSSSYHDFGFGGTSVRRTGAQTEAPGSGEYVYRGLYGGVRSFDGRGGLELVDGDVLLEVDIDDFDTTGAVEGRVGSRTAYSVNGVPLQPLPDIVFKTTTISAGGAIDQGTAATLNTDGSARDTGTYRGMFVGANGTEFAGALTLTGDFVAYRITEAVPALDANGAPILDPGGNPVTRDVSISYRDLLALRAANSARLANITVEETNETDRVRELGVFTARD